jgi:hypothetical protein
MRTGLKQGTGCSIRTEQSAQLTNTSVEFGQDL